MQIPVGRPKDLEKRQRILSVAKALFLAHGYHASSMNQIAREAGVTKLTVYNHFRWCFKKYAETKQVEF